MPQVDLARSRRVANPVERKGGQMALTIVSYPRVNLYLPKTQKALPTGFLYSYLTEELQTKDQRVYSEVCS